MTSIHPNHRGQSRRSLRSLCAAVALAAAGLSGCISTPHADGADDASSELTPLAPPSPPRFLVDPEPRALGPLQAVSEEQLELVKKDMPVGTIAIEKMSFDMDASLRAVGPSRTVNGRITRHEGRARSTQILGATPQGLVRLRVHYLQDSTMALQKGETVASTSPVEGKDYIVDVGPDGMRVLTLRGYTPPAEEVSIVLHDYAHMNRHPERDEEAVLRPGEGSRFSQATPLPQGLSALVGRSGQGEWLRPSQASTPSELVIASVRKSLEGTGVTVNDVGAQLKGVREVSGTPCAVFALNVRMRKQEPGRSDALVEMRLSGDYALRLADGWEAELLLTGTTYAVDPIESGGAEVTVNTAGFTRIHIQSSYSASEPPTARRLESLDRTPAGSSGT